MHISIIAIGRMQRGPEHTLVGDYLKRLPWKHSIIEIEIKKQSANAEERKLREADRLLAAVPDGAALVVLDEGGKALNSRAFAAKLSDWQSTGYSDIAFVIGGADGLHTSVRDKAHLKLAFGALTWPHMLVRVLLSEQIYRAWSINAGHPYHRD